MAIRQTRVRMAAFCSLMFVLATHVVAAEPKEGYSKVLVGKRFLFSQPNASAPPPLAGLDAEIIEEYDDFSLVSAANSARDAVTSQVIASGFEATVREDFDYVFINGHRIDTRLGTEKSLPNRKLDPLYPAVEKGAWLVQFVGPIKDEWLKIVATAEITVVQYVPNNACIVGADAAAIQVAARLPFVQFTDQLHTFMKPSIGPRDLASELWIHLVQTDGAEDTVARLEKMSTGSSFSSVSWSPTEVRVQGVFDPIDFETIIREPLVIAATERPRIQVSDERVALSLTSYPSRTNPKRYKKWLSDTCNFCGSLVTDEYYIGIADLGIDGGFGALIQPPINPNEPAASGNHRVELPVSRLIPGTSFEDFTGNWSEQGPYPDSTASLHDVYGHGTLVAGIAAGDADPGGGIPPQAIDADGFYWGMGVAPSAGLVITKICHSEKRHLARNDRKRSA